LVGQHTDVADITEKVVQEIYIQNLQLPEFMGKIMLEMSQVIKNNYFLDVDLLSMT